MSEVTNWNGCHGNQHINVENVKDKSNTELNKSFDAVISERISTATAAWQKNIVVPVLMNVKSENDIMIFFESNNKFRHFQKTTL